MRPRADERARERLGGAEHGDGGDGGSGLVGNVGLGKEAPPVDDYAEWLSEDVSTSRHRWWFSEDIL